MHTVQGGRQCLTGSEIAQFGCAVLNSIYHAWYTKGGGGEGGGGGGPYVGVCFTIFSPVIVPRGWVCEREV